MHTLDYARSSQRRAEGHNTVSQGLCSGATLIITPKSSQYWAYHIPNLFQFNGLLICPSFIQLGTGMASVCVHFSKALTLD